MIDDRADLRFALKHEDSTCHGIYTLIYPYEQKPTFQLLKKLISKNVIEAKDIHGNKDKFVYKEFFKNNTFQLICFNKSIPEFKLLDIKIKQKEEKILANGYFNKYGTVKFTETFEDVLEYAIEEWMKLDIPNIKPEVLNRHTYMLKNIYAVE